MMPDLRPEHLVTSLAQLGTRAMLYEVAVNPKPGLVDPVSSGPHPDMDVFLFIDSATSLTPYLVDCATAGSQFRDAALPKLFQQLRPLGQNAEREMFRTTHDVNTHKGAIFSLGILVAVTAHQITVDNNYSLKQVIAMTKEMLSGLTQNDFKSLANKPKETLTAGERQFVHYGKTGIRGEAEAGFPTVTEMALPFLRQRSGTIMARLLDTLIQIAGNTDDSNLIKRAGDSQITAWMHEQAEHYFALGGSQTVAGRHFLEALNQTFITRNLSLGGSADLLILTIYLALLDGTLSA